MSRIKYLRFIVFLLCFLILPAKLDSKENSLKLFYAIYWGPFKVGESEINISKNKYIAIVYSVGLVRIFFPFYAKWETWVDEEGHPVKTVVYSKEREKERKRIILFEEKKGKIVYQQILPKLKSPEIISLKFPIYDELSSFIASFSVDYLKVKEVKFPLFIKKKREQVRIIFNKYSHCEYKNKREKCFYLTAYLPKKSELLKRSSEVKILLLEKEKYPLQLKGKLPILGSLVGKLKKVEKN